MPCIQIYGDCPLAHAQLVHRHRSIIRQLDPAYHTSGRAFDSEGRDVLLFENEWSIRLAQENNEGLELTEIRQG